MKHKLLFLLASLLLPLAASAYDACINGIYYNIVKKANLAEVTYGDNAYSGNVVIPETVVYDGTTCYVKNIGERAFSNCELNSLTIPASIDSVWSSPRGIENLYITDLASWCNIGFYHFYPDPRSMTEQRAYTTNLINVASNLYVGNKKVSSLDIPEGVTTIKAFAFEKASMVKSVTIPSSLKSIGEDAFWGCDIESVYITNLRAWCDISFILARQSSAVGSHPFYSGDAAKRLYLNGSEVKDLVIPNGVTDLSYVFYRCSCIKTVSIPSSVTTISPNAFYGCSNMTSVAIPNSVTIIGEEAFGGCSSLTSLNIPNSVITIGVKAFYQCSSMKSVNIPSSVTTINWGAFEGCSSLISVTIPNSITQIESNVFECCSSLTSVTIPNTITVIGSSAFRGCSSLPSIIISNSVTNIGSYTFQDCKSLKSITLSENIDYIGHRCFQDCSSLTSITIPNRVDYIGENAFNGCSSLTTVVLGTRMGIGDYYSRNLDYNAFANCKELTDVYCLATAVPKCKDISVFSGSMIEYATLHVRPDMIDDYKSHDLWGKFGTITALKAGDPGLGSDTTPITFADAAFGAAATAKWDFDGNGKLSVYEALLVEDSGDTFKNNENIKSIDDLKHFTNMTTIGGNAFSGCTGLTSVTIPNNITNIGTMAFYQCSSLKSVTIPSSTKSIGNLAFGECENLSSVYISDLEAWCSINFGSSVYNNTSSYYNNVPSLAFYGTPHSLYLNGKEIKHLVIPNSVTSIGNGVFEQCDGLTSITIPNTVTSIGEGAFAFCNSLTSITIPNSVKSIGKWAFSDCEELTEVRSLIKEPFSISPDVFYYISYNNRKFTSATLYVPKGTMALYQTTNGWKNFKTIIETDFTDEPKGDLNGDALVNGTDVVSLVNVIMKGGSNAAADVNGDGQVNGTDLVALVNIIMNTSNAREVMAARSADTPFGSTDVSSATADVTIGTEPLLTNADGSRELTITLTNPQMDVTMVQLDVTLPEGLTITINDDTDMMAGRTTWLTHQLYTATTNNGRNVRLMLASGSNALIEGTEGGIIRLTLKADEAFKGGDIVLHNMLCTSPDLTEARPADVVVHFGGDTTRLNNNVQIANNKPREVYNLSGQRVSEPRKGVNIINGKKLIK